MAFKAAFADVRKTLEKELNVSYRLLNELRQRHLISQCHVEILMVYATHCCMMIYQILILQPEWKKGYSTYTCSIRGMYKCILISVI